MEPRLKVTFAPSFADWPAPGVSGEGGAATTEIETLALVAAPALSVTLNVIVYEPAVAYAWPPVQVPEPPLSLTIPVELIPSPHLIVHVWVSAVPVSRERGHDLHRAPGAEDRTGRRRR